jgi:hypothetical protein
MVLRPVILDPEEVEIRKIPGQARQKFHKTPSQPVAGCGGMCLSSQLYAQIEDCGTGLPGHKVRTFLKNNQRKKGWQSGSSAKVPA